MENNFETLGFAFMCDSENGALSAKARASIIHCVIKHNAFFGLNQRNKKWNSWVLRTSSSCPPSSSVGGGNLQVTDCTCSDQQQHNSLVNPFDPKTAQEGGNFVVVWLQPLWNRLTSETALIYLNRLSRLTFFYFICIVSFFKSFIYLLYFSYALFIIAV